MRQKNPRRFPHTAAHANARPSIPNITQLSPSQRALGPARGVVGACKPSGVALVVPFCKLRRQPSCEPSGPRTATTSNAVPHSPREVGGTSPVVVAVFLSSRLMPQAAAPGGGPRGYGSFRASAPSCSATRQNNRVDLSLRVPLAAANGLGRLSRVVVPKPAVPRSCPLFKPQWCPGGCHHSSHDFIQALLPANRHVIVRPCGIAKRCSFTWRRQEPSGLPQAM